MKKPRLGTRMLTTGVVIAVALIAVVVLFQRFFRHPWTRDGQVQADVVMMAPRVTGTVVSVHVIDNQFVRAGDPLFRIDPSDFELAVASARVQLEQARQQVASLEAAVVAAEAGVTEAAAAITTARAQIDSARAQVSSAEGLVAGGEAGVKSAEAYINQSSASLEQANRDRDRAKKLADQKAGSVASAESQAAGAKEAVAVLEGARAGLQEAQATLDQHRASLLQAQAGLVSAEAGLGESEAKLASARAGLIEAEANLGAHGDENVQVRAAEVALASNELDLSRATIAAPSDGYVTNLSVDVGDYAAAGTPLLAFVDVASFHVLGFFRETQLRHIEIGDRALVTLLSHGGRALECEVESIGWAINPPDVATTDGTSGLVPQVEPSFDWIRLAQRVPVRIKLGEVPEGVRLISGTTVSVAIRPQE